MDLSILTFGYLSEWQTESFENVWLKKKKKTFFNQVEPFMKGKSLL